MSMSNGFDVSPDSEAEKTVWQIITIRFRSGAFPAVPAERFRFFDNSGLRGRKKPYGR